MTRICAAVGCYEQTDGRMFCKLHTYARDRNAVEQAPEKARVRIVKGLGLYRATHSAYWDGIGETPGEALRAMAIQDDGCPF